MNAFLFVAVPYLALVLAVLGGLYRYYANRFSYSSISSQVLESRKLFWGSVPWHYGIIPILLAHLLAGLFPGTAARILGSSGRLLVLELLGMALGLFTAFGIVVLIIRRVLRNSPAHKLTSIMDGILLAVLAVQVVTGVGTAMFARWGSLWYLHTAVPWFWSIVRLEPDASAVAVLPSLVKFHMVNGFVVILLFPFTRLVHVFTVPLDYLWRPYQVVIWNHRARRPEDLRGS